MKPKEMELNEWKALSEEILSKIAMEAAKLGGAVSGEHGIGFLKKDLLKETKTKQYEIMKGLKAFFDPNGIMNPGKLF